MVGPEHPEHFLRCCLANTLTDRAIGSLDKSISTGYCRTRLVPCLLHVLHAAQESDDAKVSEKTKDKKDK